MALLWCASQVSDFGMSSDFSPGLMLETSVGSLAYSAPEILLGDRYFGEGVGMESVTDISSDVR